MRASMASSIIITTMVVLLFVKQTESVLDFTCFNNKSRIDVDGDDDLMIGGYKSGDDTNANVTFGRTSYTGTGYGLPRNSSKRVHPVYDVAPAKQLLMPRSGLAERIGVFYCEAEKDDGQTERITTIIMDQDSHVTPHFISITVNVGESVTLSVDARDSQYDLEWYKNNVNYDGNGSLPDWSGRAHNTINSSKEDDAGIYECCEQGQRSKGKHAIMQLLVRACPDDRWGAPQCQSVCPRCYNGGICDDRSGECVCAPGFSGVNCKKVHGRNKWGQDGRLRCIGPDDHVNACRGRLFCLPHPYGCSCAAGFKGIDCNEECDAGFYGANCRSKCHCAVGVSCLKDTGECNGGNCHPYWCGVNCQEYCPPKCGPDKTNDTNQSLDELNWPEADVNETVFSTETCPVSTEKRGFPYGNRTCVIDEENGVATFEEPLLFPNPCGNKENATLDDIAKTPVNDYNVIEVAEALRIVTGEQQLGDTADVIATASTTIQNMVNVGSPSPNVTIGIVATVGNILTLEPSHETEVDASDSSQIIRSLEQQVARTLEEGLVRVDSETLIALESVMINETTPRFTVGFMVTDSLTISPVFVNESEALNSKIESSISLPPSLTNSSGAKSFFLVYKNDSLFVSQNYTQSFTTKVKVIGDVVSSEVYGVKTSDLSEPVIITFYPSKQCITKWNSNSIKCVSWDFNLQNGTGDWSEEGCEFVNVTSDGHILCQCSHLTNFAAVATKSVRNPVLDYISITRCALSLSSMIIMLAIFFLFRKLRQAQPRAVLIQLCVSLFGLYSMFIVVFSIDKREGYDPECKEDVSIECIIVASLLQYFTLTTLMWMAVEAQLLFRLLVVIYGARSNAFFKCACASAWGIPVVVVSICLGAGFKEYKKLEHCFVSDTSFLSLAVIIPIALVLVHNLVIFILVLRSLLKSRVQGHVSQDKTSAIWQRFRQAICITLLVGLAWVFGILAVIDDKTSGDVFAWLFVICNAFQGFGIFIVFCILQDDVRMALSPYFRWVTIPTITSSRMQTPDNIELQ